MNDSFKWQLEEWRKKNMPNKPNKKNRSKKKAKRTNKQQGNDYSFQEIEQLMGIRRPIYSRGRGGAYRQRN